MVVAALVPPAVTACGTGSAHPEPTVESALSQSPVADALYRCITDRGWTVTLTSDGGIDASSDTIPKEQYDRYLADTWACNSEVSARFPVDDRQKHLLYGAELAERDCLEAHGYAVDEAPSLQTFLDGYESRAWSAMASSDVARLSQTMAESEWEAINRSCPQPVPGALK
ncbi:hypothetical protein B7R25_06650 [Subtercola boreus]|uniref:Uncharacterized protein n=2 Tax=Subtercola boreus TaxID=120213 RepID=A0A3E0WDR8_9MICO|nr:hypothetical protein B7R24_06580 [Subtercola boreus]RFA21451.1 hypothetical protein B7R23_06525 [Subtercola boreus]RFA27422.1 hypothetical protein B7R25_06650 [Subtercola boreus]